MREAGRFANCSKGGDSVSGCSATSMSHTTCRVRGTTEWAAHWSLTRAATTTATAVRWSLTLQTPRTGQGYGGSTSIA
jgi:hypothetical protein